MTTRITGQVESLEANQIFVFGSNTAGRHGKGAAKTAMRWGAKTGVGVGLSGNTYGIPTKDGRLKTLSLTKIKRYVDEFIAFAAEKNEYVFLVTEIGCGLAGYTPNDIAPMFANAMQMENVYLPHSFVQVRTCRS